MPRNVAEWQSEVLGQDQHVYRDSELSSGKDFTSAATIVLAARLGTTTDGSFEKETNDAPASWETIGVVQNASVAQNKQLAQIFEVGSRESYFVPGRTVVQATLSRVMIDGDSLMKVVYPEVDSVVPTDTVVNTGFMNTKADRDNIFYINLASDFFNNSLDLAFFFYDGENAPLGAFYLKGAHIQAHQISLASQQTVVLENISLRANQVIGLSV